jgi:hypothetical protein
MLTVHEARLDRAKRHAQDARFAACAADKGADPFVLDCLDQLCVAVELLIAIEAERAAATPREEVMPCIDL